MSLGLPSHMMVLKHLPLLFAHKYYKSHEYYNYYKALYSLFLSPVHQTNLFARLFTCPEDFWIFKNSKTLHGRAVNLATLTVKLFPSLKKRYDICCNSDNYYCRKGSVISGWLTLFTSMSYFYTPWKTSVNWFPLLISWLVSIWWKNWPFMGDHGSSIRTPDYRMNWNNLEITNSHYILYHRILFLSYCEMIFSSTFVGSFVTICLKIELHCSCHLHSFSLVF